MLRSVMALVAAMAVATPAMAVPVVNFETPALSGGGGAYRYFLQPGGGFPGVPNGFDPIPGVTFTGATGIQRNGSDWGFNNTPDGAQTAFIQSYNGVGGTITVALSGLSVGQRYVASFLAAQRPGYGNNPFTVTATGSSTGFSTTNTQWTRFTKSFTATGTTANLTFAGSSIPGDSGVGIDAIGLSVPEPATWGLLMLGFGTVGGVMRRRARKSVAFA